MNASIDIIVYLSTDWKESSGSAKGYAFGDAPFLLALSRIRGVRILAVNQPFTPLETVIRKPGKALRWLRGERLERLNDNLFLYTPAAFVHEMVAVHVPLLERINRAVLRLQLRRRLAALGFTSARRAAMIYHPVQRSYFGLVDESLKVFKCWDRYGARDYARRARARIARHEEALTAEADAILTPCIKLFQELKARNPNTHFTPAGVDLVEAEPSAAPRPEEFRELPAPIIGFAGRITSKVDLKLVDFLAQSHPEWSLVMVGSVSDTDASFEEYYPRVRSRPNVHFLGFREFDDLPSYIRSFDVCLLPHSSVASMQYAHPYKTLQYLALGKPVVATDFPDARYYQDVIGIASGHEEFASLVERALADAGTVASKRREAFAARNTWDRRAAETLEILQRS